MSCELQLTDIAFPLRMLILLTSKDVLKTVNDKFSELSINKSDSSSDGSDCGNCDEDEKMVDKQTN